MCWAGGCRGGGGGNNGIICDEFDCDIDGGGGGINCGR